MQSPVFYFTTSTVYWAIGHLMIYVQYKCFVLMKKVVQPSSSRAGSKRVEAELVDV